MTQLFGTDRVLMYDVHPWNVLGFGVANFGSKSKVSSGSIDTVGTLNQSLWALADEIGRSQLFIMSHNDARRRQPPSRNTIERLGKVLNRVQTVLAGRAMETNQLLLEPGHSSPAPLIWNIHPVPYFAGPFLENHWLREYNALVMVALVNFYQHSDNNLALTVTMKFAQDIYQYFREIKIKMGTELLLLPRKTVEADDFLFLPAHYDKYLPNDLIMNTEAGDGPGNMFAQPTLDTDLALLYQGIPANMILPMLKQYPIGPLPGATGLSGEDTIDADKGAAGTVTGSAIGPATV